MDKNEKRSPDFGVIPNAIKRFNKEECLQVYRNICRARAFDIQVINAVQKGRVIAPVYLSLGQEAVAAALALDFSNDWLFSQHRAHDLYLSISGDPVAFRDELLGLPTGFSGGRAGSSCLKYMKDGKKLVGHHGLIGENVPQAVGAAIATGERTICICGDGSGEEDYVLESIGFAVTRKLPLLIICADNDLSILTHVSERRTWELADVAKGFGMEAYDVSDCPWTILTIVRQWNAEKPLFLNCRVCRERWHSGIGIDEKREWERNIIVREQLCNIGLEREIMGIEIDSESEMRQLWAE